MRVGGNLQHAHRVEVAIPQTRRHAVTIDGVHGGHASLTKARSTRCLPAHGVSFTVGNECAGARDAPSRPRARESSRPLRRAQRQKEAMKATNRSWANHPAIL